MSLYSDLNAVLTPYANKIKQNEANIRTALSIEAGSPTVVSSVSDMTDTDQIYVLSTDGMWYYHNGTAWTAGGEYGGVAAGSITTDKLANKSVTTAKIDDGAVTWQKLASGAVHTGELADSAVTNVKLADSSVSERKLASGAVTTAKIANGAIMAEKLGNAAVTAEKIADGTITKAKLSSDIAFCVSQSASVDIVGSWNGDFTNGVITPADVSLSVFAACVPGVQYTISKTPTQRFSVFFTDQYPQIGLPIMEYRIIDQKTAASITAVAPEGAKYICAYVYNRNTDSGYGTMEEVGASVHIVVQSAVDAVSRNGLNVSINRIDDIEKALHGGNVSLTWEHGGIGLNGVTQPDTKRIRTSTYIDKSEMPTNIILSGSDYQFSVRYYDSSGTFINSDSAWRSASLYDAFAQVDNCEKIKIISRLSTNAEMTDTDMENVQSALSVSISSISDVAIPSSVRQAIYNLFAHAAYSTTANVSNDIATLQSWAEVE